MIINNTISQNHADYAGGGIYCDSSLSHFTNNIIWDNGQNEVFIEFIAPFFDYCDIQDTLVSGNGNISVDPLFRNPDNADFHLMATYCGDPYNSPCIDVGDPDNLDYILDCDFGQGGERSDMGAYGGDNLGYPTEIFEQELIIPESVELLQNYPNPFNAITTIKYYLPSESDISLSIYNLLGQRIEILFNGTQTAGDHSVAWDASRIPSGIYFARLEAAGRAENSKMLLLK